MTFAAPAVSVLLPCYNAASTLAEALDSLFGSTYTNFEVVAIDDGSTDGTAALLNAWAQKDARLRVVYQPHAGIVAALQHGLRECRADRVARMDSDDYCFPERLALQMSYLDQHAETAVVSCLVEGFPSGDVRMGFRIYLDWLNSLVEDIDIQREIFVESPLPHPSVLFRRDRVMQAGGYQEHGWAEDYDLWLRLHLAGAHFAKVPQVLLGWREHPQRLTRTDPRYSLENFLRAKAHYLVLGPLHGCDAAIVWGAGMTGRRLSKHLVRGGAPLVAFIDIDPRKIGRTRRGAPVFAPGDLPALWARYTRPILLAAVGARGARILVRRQLESFGLVEGLDWWSVA